MSGAHSQHRTPNVEQVINGVPVIKFDSHGRPTRKHKLVPGQLNVDGRPAEYQVLEYFATRHVLDYRPAYHRPSKHAGGRTRPRTRAEQRTYRNRVRRLTQIRKTLTVDTNRLAAELAA